MGSEHLKIQMSGRDPGLPLSPVLAAIPKDELEAAIAELEAELAAEDGENG